ncbi:MAG TPA: GH1 family beta-glucosidase [Anaerolineales bacterium]|nr:GH1 family beta-glucosidase [Anaerolineales bacterium]
MNTDIKFPPGFLWGSATSSYQIEGAWNIDGKGESIWDRFAHTPGKVKNRETGDVACDHYHRWQSDLALMKELGLQAYRFSVAWPRVLPSGTGALNRQGLDFYSRLVDSLLEAGIQPFVTLYHWDLPQALQEQGGWPARSTAEAFVGYADTVSRLLGDRVKYWITHNEPEVVATQGYFAGRHAPGVRDLGQSVRTSHHLLLSHGWAVQAIRSNCPQAEAGITLNTGWIMAASNSQADLNAARERDGKLIRWYADPLYGRGYPVDAVSHYQALGALPEGLDFIQPGDMQAIATPTDFLGVNYYSREVIRSRAPDNAPRTVFPAPKDNQHWTEMDWEVYSDGLLGVLVRLYSDYQLPKIYITENGASYSDGPDANGRIPDSRRQDYLRTHFIAAQRAIQVGVPLAGYFVWSLMDNFEWAYGYSQRFGIIWVDFQTQQRILKDSARWYASVIARNGFASDTSSESDK